MHLTALSPPFVLLEDRLGPDAGGLLFSAPHQVVVCHDPDRVDGALEAIEAGLSAGLHAAGWFSYELGHVLEPRLRCHLTYAAQVPLLWFGLFAPPRRIGAEALDAAFASLAPPPPVTGLAPGHDRATHVAKVGEILALIGAGDIYQANLTFPMRFEYHCDPLPLYAALRAAQPVGHGGVVVTEATSVLSVSPELWVDVTDGRAVTRPMKGTTARGADPRQDQAAAEALMADPKQRAENLMIVDLLRNDLARISMPGTVRTPSLFALETYPSFHTLTSTVTARLRPEQSLRARLEALFPCGSIVGAPKIRAAQILAELEDEPRGVYTGAIGAMTPTGDLRFNVAIRTAVIGEDGRGCYGVGGGIVADSDPEAEYEEALLKGKILKDLAEDYALFETLRWTPAEGFSRLPLHLDRLQHSAAALGFGFERLAAEAWLLREAQRWGDQQQDRRVRITLGRAGDLGLTQSALQPLEGEASAPPVRVALAGERLDPGDPFLRHKTTRRGLYDGLFAQAQNAGFDEILFLNRQGAVAEGSRSTVFVQAGDRLATPPLSAGVLPGVLRRALIDRGEAFEAPLTLDDLTSAPAWFIGSSLRGLRRAVLVV